MGSCSHFYSVTVASFNIPERPKAIYSAYAGNILTFQCRIALEKKLEQVMEETRRFLS